MLIIMTPFKFNKNTSMKKKTNLTNCVININK